MPPAELLFKAPESDKPTILPLIDRNELEDQLLKNLAALGMDNVEHTHSIARLNQLLRQDHRGLIVSTIHKFRDMPANLNQRRNIYVLMDEAHRTTGGDLGNYLMAALPNATYLGFTGAPIDRTAYGQDTFKTFSVVCPLAELVLKWSPLESAPLIRQRRKMRDYTLCSRPRRPALRREVVGCLLPGGGGGL